MYSVLSIARYEANLSVSLHKCRRKVFKGRGTKRTKHDAIRRWDCADNFLCLHEGTMADFMDRFDGL